VVTERVLVEAGLAVGLSEGESDWGNDWDTFAVSNGRVVVPGREVEGGGGALSPPSPESKSQAPFMTPASVGARDSNKPLERSRALYGQSGHCIAALRSRAG
jgi:hypothetical protein